MVPTFPPTKTPTLCYKFGIHRALHRGDVVALRKPTDAESVVVKRVVGLEGDVVRVRVARGRRGVIRAGKKGLWEEGEHVVVPRGCVWVEGDNEDASVDSNVFGAVSGTIQGEGRLMGGGVGYGGSCDERRLTRVMGGDRCRWGVLRDDIGSV